MRYIFFYENTVITRVSATGTKGVVVMEQTVKACYTPEEVRKIVFADTIFGLFIINIFLLSFISLFFLIFFSSNNAISSLSSSSSLAKSIIIFLFSFFFGSTIFFISKKSGGKYFILVFLKKFLNIIIKILFYNFYLLN